MNELLTSLITTLQALVVLLAAQASGTAIESPESDLLVAQAQALISSLEQPTEAPLSFTEINTLTTDAVVNILCRGSGQFTSTTGSGVIISEGGMILTNAHIGQYVLLEQASNATISCVIRTGNPAKNTYRAKLVYISPAWIAEHAYQVRQEEQRGTGEDDYALLQITESIDPAVPLPTTFPYITPLVDLLGVSPNEQVLLRGYPAEFIGSSITLRSLQSVGALTYIQNIRTFASGESQLPTPDLLSLGGSIVAQGGSSGGAVVTSENKLAGIIVTSTRTAETKDRNLSAITLSHIDRSLLQQAGKDLPTILSTPLEELVVDFSETLDRSAEVLVEQYR
jgi:hypothetical protein